MNPLGHGSLQMDRGMVPLVLFGHDNMLRFSINLYTQIKEEDGRYVEETLSGCCCSK